MSGSELKSSVQGRKGLEPIPADMGREEGYTVDRSPGLYRADKDNSISIHVDRCTGLCLFFFILYSLK